MGRLVRVAIVVVPLAGAFGRLFVDPHALLVDSERANVDTAVRAENRLPGNDLTRLFLPHHMRIAERIHQTGRLPLWDPAGFGGRPFVGNPQASLFYPPVWLVWRSREPAALGWVTVAHLLWAALGLYTLCRSQAIGSFASSVAAGSLIVSPYMIAQVNEGHYPHVWSACWYPWAFLSIRAWHRGNRVGSLALAPILALSFLAGHPQEWYYLVLALGTWSVACIGSEWRAQNGLAAGGLDDRSERGVSAEQQRASASWNHWPTGNRPLTNLLHRDRCARAAIDVETRGRSVVLMSAALPNRVAIKSVGRLLCWGALVGSLAIGLMAVELIPDGLAARWSLRGARLSLGEASRYHVSPLNLLQLLTPRALGGPSDYFGHDNYWEPLLSFGWVALMLASVGLSCWSHRVEVRGWVILAGASVVFAAGHRFGLFAILFEIAPGMERFRVPARALFLTNLAVAVLFGYGLDALSRKDYTGVNRRYWRVVLVIAFGLALAQVVAWKLNVGHDTPALYGGGAGDGQSNRERELGRWLRGCSRIVRDRLFWGVVLGAGGLMTIARVRPACKKPATAALGFLALGELACLGFDVLSTAPVSSFVGADPMASALRTLGGTEPFRVRARDAFFPDIRAVQSGLEKTNLNDHFQIQDAAELYQRLYAYFEQRRPLERLIPALGRQEDAIRQAVLDRMNVRFLVSDRPDRRAEWPVAGSGSWNGRRWTIYRNHTALPRAYVVPRALVTPDEGDVVAVFPRVRPTEAVVMSTDPLRDVDVRQSFTAARYDASNPDRVVVNVTTRAPGLLVIADTWMPGWTALLDGRPVAILRGNRAQRVVVVKSPGQHELTMSYGAPGLVLGASVTATSAVVWLGIVVATLRRRIGGSGASAQDGSEAVVRLDSWEKGPRVSLVTRSRTSV
jgi:hypothetical protein